VRSISDRLIGAAFPLTEGEFAESRSQQPKKIHRIGYLVTGDAASESTRSEAIRLGLRELGYIEGQNIAFEYRYAEQQIGS